MAEELELKEIELSDEELATPRPQPPNQMEESSDEEAVPKRKPKAKGRKKKAYIDAHGSQKYMTLTVSPREDLSLAQIEALIQFHRVEGPFALLISELRPGDSVMHFHSVFQSKAIAPTKVREKVERMLKRAGVEVTVSVTVKVRRCSDLIGWFHYCTKDASYVRHYIKGWQMSWIKEQCVANIKKIPFAVLLKDKHHITAKGATARILAYAKAQGTPVSGKEAFKDVVCAMAREGYEFQNVKMKWCYSQCMAMCGCDRAMRSLLDGELQFLD